MQRFWAEEASLAQLGSGTFGVSEEAVVELRRKRFESLAKTVELGLRDYSGERGETALLSLMRSRYGSTYDGKRQLAILFTFLEGSAQPVAAISKLVAAADNATVMSVDVVDGGSGYTLSSKQLPEAWLSKSSGSRNATYAADAAAEARAVGEDGAAAFAAVAQAPVRPSGKLWVAGSRPGQWLNGAALPRVVLSEPLAPRVKDRQSMTQAQAVAQVVGLEATGIMRAVVLRSGGSGYQTPPTVTIAPPANPAGRAASAVAVLGQDGAVVAVRLTDAGSGYESSKDGFQVPVEFYGDHGGAVALADGLLDLRVNAIRVVSQGFGYGTTQPLAVVIEPPPPIPESAAPMPNCVGLPPQRAARGKAVLDYFGRQQSEAKRRGDFWLTPGPELANEFTALLPSSLVPELVDGTYRLNVDALDTRGGSRNSDPVFGGVAAKGVSREVKLTPKDYAKVAAAGALCTALIRIVLSPLELVKTRLQLSPPDVYKDANEPAWKVCAESIMDSAESPDADTRASSEEGSGGFVAQIVGARTAVLFRGADASGAVGVVLGGASFVQVEIYRRFLEEALGPEITQVRKNKDVCYGLYLWQSHLFVFSCVQYYEIPIFLVSTLGAVFVTCLLACPFESARVRLMASLGAQGSGDGSSSSEPSQGPTTLGGMLQEMLDQGGGSPLALWSGLPPLVLRETLFSIPKFLVFNWASSALGAGLQSLPLPPSIADSIAATLAVSLLAGALAGVAGAIVSSPADALLTKSGGVEQPTAAASSNSDGTASVSVSPAKESGGIFAGAGVRCLFFAASISVQFLLYDAFRAALHVSPQDFMEGLDVFADRLSFYPEGPISGP